MKKVIFTQEWMAMHPYEKPDDVDQYYTELANEIYHALDEACFTHQFKNVEDAKQLALCIAGYFEDVISGTCVWKTFTAECKKRYGSYIPFYEHEDEFIKNTLNESEPPYDPDEINFADIKFLCWHHYQQSTYVQEAVPFLFSTMELAAKLAYNVLDKEYETAPENTRLYDFLCELPTDEEHFYEYRDALAWFHYGCFFNINNRKRLQFELENLARSPQGFNEIIAYSIQIEHTMNSRNNLLALTSAEWLAKVSEHHEKHKLWTDIDYMSTRAFKMEKEDEKYFYLKDLYEETSEEESSENSSEKPSEDNKDAAETKTASNEESLIPVLKESTQIEDASAFLNGEQILITNLFKFGGEWWQTGALLNPLYAENKEQIEAEKARLNHKQGIHDYNLLKAKGYGDKFIFLEDVKTLKDFLKEIGFELSKDIRFPQKYEKGIILCGSPYTGINISFGLAHCIASPENPYYSTERAAEDCFNIVSGNGRPFPYEIVCKLIENNMIPDANIFTSRYVKEEGLKITQANLQFLADYYLMGRKDKDLSPKELW